MTTNKMVLRKSIVCPPVSRPSQRQIDSATSLFDCIRTFAASERPGVTHLIGREVRVAFALVSHAEATATAANKAPAAIARCRSLFLRPAIEPILLSYWQRFTAMDFTKIDALQLASALVGRSAAYATRPMGTMREGLPIAFEPREIASQWLDDVLMWRADQDLAPLWPIYGYARVILAHPFRDGNGRFARAFFQGCLAAHVGLKAPVIAMAPSFYRHMTPLTAALEALSDQGNWEGFVDAFAAAVRDAIADSRE
jgi:Fic/DOC family